MITNTSIFSDPVKVCLCSPDENYDTNCNQSYSDPIKVRKGEAFEPPVVAIDQAGHLVDATIQSSLYHTESGLDEGQLTRTVSAICTNLSFSVTSLHDNEELSLYAMDGPCKDADLSMVTAKIRFLPCECPIGFQPSAVNLTNCTCDCDEHISSYVQCDAQSESLLRQGLSNVWLSYDNISGFLIYPNCPFDYCKPQSLMTSINLNQPGGVDAQCAFNRSGLLCGSCRTGLSLSIGSSLCLSCPSHWPALLVSITIAAILAGMAHVAVLLVLNITVAVGTLNGLIFYANVLAAYRSILLPFPEQNYVTVLISWLNLELGIDSCFIEGMDTYSKTWLQLAFPTYVICLVVTIIVVCSYSSKFSNVIGKKDPVATLATLVLLSFAKLIEITFKALAHANLEYLNGPNTLVWLPDATVNYFGGKHIILFIAAIAIMIMSLIYTILVFAWQWLLLLPDWKVFSWTRNTKLQTFIETYHKPYAPRHRYWTGLLLLVRIILYVVVTTNISNDPHKSLTSVIFTIGILLALKGFFGKIYKKWAVDALETFFYFNVLLISVFTWYSLSNIESNREAAAYTSVTITFIVLLSIIVYHAFSFTSLSAKLHCANVHVKLTRLFEPGSPLKPNDAKRTSEDDDENRFRDLFDVMDLSGEHK